MFLNFDGYKNSLNEANTPRIEFVKSFVKKYSKLFGQAGGKTKKYDRVKNWKNSTIQDLAQACKSMPGVSSVELYKHLTM